MAYIDTSRSTQMQAALRAKTAQKSHGIFGIFRNLQSALETAQRRKKLYDMPPHLLRDIGFSQGDIDVLNAEKHLGADAQLTNLQRSQSML